MAPRAFPPSAPWQHGAGQARARLCRNPPSQGTHTVPQKGLELLTSCGLLTLPAACAGLDGVRDGQPFPGFVRLAAERVLVPAHPPSCPQPLLALTPTSPPRCGLAGDTGTLKGMSVEGAAPRLLGVPGCRRTVPALTDRVCVICSRGHARVEGTGLCEGPPAPPAARPELVSLWGGTKQFLSLSFLHRHVMNLPHM